MPHDPHLTDSCQMFMLTPQPTCHSSSTNRLNPASRPCRSSRRTLSSETIRCKNHIIANPSFHIWHSPSRFLKSGMSLDSTPGVWDVLVPNPTSSGQYHTFFFYLYLALPRNHQSRPTKWSIPLPLRHVHIPRKFLKHRMASLRPRKLRRTQANWERFWGRLCPMLNCIGTV